MTKSSKFHFLGLFFGFASCAVSLAGCKFMGKGEKSEAKQNFGNKQPGIKNFNKMGIYRSGKQYCQNEPEFHLKKEEDHSPFANVYGWVCIDPSKGLIEVRDGLNGIFATGVLKDPNRSNGSSNVETKLGASYEIRDGQNMVVAYLNQDQNWTVQNLVQKTFQITNRSTTHIATSTKLPFTFLYTSFGINSPSGQPLAKVWSHFWNWTIEDLQDEKIPEVDRLTLRRVLYVVPMIYELKNQMDGSRQKINSSNSQGATRTQTYDDPAAPPGYDPYSNPQSGNTSSF